LARSSLWNLPALVVLSQAGARENTDMKTHPITIIATIEGSTIDAVAGKIAEHFIATGKNADGEGTGWIVAGHTAGHEPLGSTLKVPGGQRIIEVCKPTYAQRALSFGLRRALGLPCKIGVIEDAGGIQVLLLDPGAVSELFFGDIPTEDAPEMADLSTRLRSELVAIVEGALEGLDGYTASDTPVGPVWESDDLAAFREGGYAVELSIAVPADREGDAGSFRAQVVEALLSTATHEGLAEVGSRVPGLSVGDWRAARSTPINLPGGITMVELCSPTYATAALDTGVWHIPALPCKVAVFVEGGQVKLSVLDTDFMFPTFFGDIPEEMGPQLQGMATAVRTDITAIVQSALSTLQ